MQPASAERRPSTIAGHGLFADVDHPVSDVVITFADDVGTVDDLGPLNHSCDPNLGWTDARSLAARRDIAAGEELTVDYSTAFDDPAFVLYCHCGSTRCRQAVAGDDWRIPQLQARYVDAWSPRLAQRIARDR